MRKKYLIEVILFFSYVLFAMAWVGGTSFMGEIMNQMKLESLAAGSLISTSITLAKIVGTAIAAWIMIKIGVRKAFIAASIMVCAGIFTPYSSSYAVLLLSRFLMGLGGALIVVYFNPIVVQWFEEKERPVVNGLNAVAFNVGTALTMFFVNDFVRIFGGWRETLLAISISSIFFMVLWICFGTYKETGTKKDKSKADTEYSFVDGLKDSFNWKLSLTYAGLLSFYVVLFTFYPNAGVSAAKLVILFGIVGAVAGIIYSQKFPKRVPVIKWSGLCQIIAIVGLSFFKDSIIVTDISAVILGFFVFFPMTALVTLAQEQPDMTPRKISVTFSIFWSVSYLFASIVPTIFGKIVDMNNGNYFPAFVFITIISTSFFIGSFFLPEAKKAVDGCKSRRLIPKKAV